MTPKPGSPVLPSADLTPKFEVTPKFEGTVRQALNERPDPAVASRPDTPAGAAGYEAKAASGFARRAGKHVAWSGPLQRNGRAKVFNEETEHEAWLAEQNTHELIEIAERVLHHRNATVFDGLVLAPIRKLPGRTVDSLAAQFGVDAARIYRIKNDCVARIKSELGKARAAPEAPRLWGPPPASEVSETCTICRRDYPLSAWPKQKPICHGHFGSRPHPGGDIHPDCLIARRTAMWDAIKTDMTPERRAELAAQLRAKLQAQDDWYHAMRKEDHRRWERDRRDVEALMRARQEQFAEDREQAEIDRIFGTQGGGGEN